MEGKKEDRRKEAHVGQPADSVEFCPTAGHHNFFACGTYQLLEEEKKKVGQLHLYQVHKEEGVASFTERSRQDRDAILDLKWSTVADCALLGEVDSKGSLSIFKLDEGKLNLLCSTQVVDGALALSLDWNNRVQPSGEPLLTVSQSNGGVSICQLSNTELKVIRAFVGHEYEAWVSAFDYFHPNVVYSGADDCNLKLWDIRENAPQCLLTKQYDAGVTSIQSSPHQENCLAVGSYDESITIWDTRTMKQPQYRISTEIGGGVWRIKWHPLNSGLLAAACMRTGFKVIDMSPTPRIVSTIKETCESLAYGVDWSFDLSSHLIAACSFYDCHLTLWEPSL